MEYKQRFFIYDRKEMGVLILLGLMVALFAFTLGVHLGKRAIVKVPSAAPSEAANSPMVGDASPSRQELNEQGKVAAQAADDTLKQTLHEEVTKTGIQLDTPRQVDLPEKTAAEKRPSQADAKAEANTETNTETKPDAKAGVKTSAKAGAPFTNTAGESAGIQYTLQIGSFPSEAEASGYVKRISGESGLLPFVREVEIKGKGRWFRVFTGSYPTKDQAEKAGLSYQSRKMIHSFVVSRMTAPSPVENASERSPEKSPEKIPEKIKDQPTESE